jgi:membrane protein
MTTSDESGDRAASEATRGTEPANTSGPTQATEPPQATEPTDSAPAGAADQPTELPARSWVGALKRAVKEYKADNVGDLSAALTYYGVLAVFPALIALLSILGLVGRSTTKPLIDSITKIVPGSAQHIFTNAIHDLQRSRGGASIVFIIGILLALWSASGYVSAFMRTNNAIYGVEENRPFWKLAPLRLGITIVLVVLLAFSAVAVVVTGSIARQVGDTLGVGSSAVSAWDIAKWPVLLLIVSFMITLLYWASPNVKHPGFGWLAPGAVFALVVWIFASLLFALYAAGFSSYNKTYGALAGVIVFLVWLWITNVALLIGVELNAELARGRAIKAGAPADDESFVEPREA